MPTTALAASGAPPTADSLRPYTEQNPKWEPCDAESPAALRCATVEVPLDYGDPGGKRIKVAISRLKATGTKERRGVLLFNPGGPGGPGLKMPAELEGSLSGEVKRRYDLIGFDPRGIGRSTPVGCGLTPGELTVERPYNASTFARDVEWARTVADKCRIRNGDALAHLTTRDTARDMDVIRAVLGEKKLSYMGFSYGTYLGAVYTQMFPERTDRFVLDSATDPARYGRGLFRQIAEGTEPAFARWTRWTAERHSTYGLGDTPAGVRATFWKLVARADRTPVAYEGRSLTGDDIRAERHVFFRVEKAATWVAGLRKAAENGEKAPSGTPGRAPDRPVPAASAADPTPENEIAGLWAVLCADTSRSWPRDPERYRRDAVRDKARYPLYGDLASGIKPCAFWKPGSEPPTTVNNHVKALILQNEWDPQTPLAAARGMHRALRGSRMVTVAGGEGHGVHGTNSCADRSAAVYLTTGRLPDEDLTCAAETRDPS
ncbi:alpha/beta hydrolase [Streptomyces albireticuli]|uniref:Alpha/beta hydrolase n=2 Tax=Streptomyces albireticuli TaxID=1940 RepID=A0A2A2D9X2_9ACTN|nr:alpha/beta hydrolase [Streptomyces albireticuli]MCD9140962.1 alpha/beta hydrolase [Streptomyces albireticuli]MCD9161076.1 alpha/beta hydrolase [Streptomyces albireticuli]MCD9190866.1 alpha/beta hydrolase [Streptomyces albireticuli]PAU48314.1 alpha/beta hydrolase [Streptomyces albireticuli]